MHDDMNAHEIFKISPSLHAFYETQAIVLNVSSLHYRIIFMLIMF